MFKKIIKFIKRILNGGYDYNKDGIRIKEMGENVVIKDNKSNI